MRGLVLCLLALLLPMPAVAQSLDDVPMQGTTTRAAVRAAWGEPAERRGQWERYPLATGGELHLLFSPLAPHRLVRAELVGAMPGRRAGQRLFSVAERIAGRAVEQIDPCATEEGAVVPIWGTPNYSEHPTNNRFYAMADGTWVRLGPPDASRGIDVVRGSDHGLIRRIAPETCPRRGPVPAPADPYVFDEESIDPFIPPRLLSDIRLDASTTRADIAAVWGALPMIDYGSWASFPLASDETVRLLFDQVAPHGLVYADLVAPGTPARSRRLFSHNPRAASRSLGEVDPCVLGAPRQWGPPDYSWGSGLVHSYYALANGDEVEFGPQGRISVIGRDGAWNRLTCPTGTPRPPPFGSGRPGNP